MEMTAEPRRPVSRVVSFVEVSHLSRMNTRGDSKTVAAALTSYRRLSLSTIKKRQREVLAAATNQL